MFFTQYEYDWGVNTLPPRKRLFQVDYAIQVIKNGFTAIYPDIIRIVATCEEKNHLPTHGENGRG
jgi:hypothetical protein